MSGLIYISGDQMVWIRTPDKLKSKAKAVLTLVLTFAAIYCAINFSQECSVGILNGLSFCITVLIPSLFIFMVIASYIANSKVSVILSKLLSRPTEKLLNLPGECSLALILSLLGGYPVGARCIAALYDNGSINKSQAQKLSMMAVCAGPGFVLNYIGDALLNNKKAGTVLLVSQIISFIVVAIIFGRGIKVKVDYVDNKTVTHSTGIVDAVHSGCIATVNMCAMVIVFSAVISVCDKVLYSYPILCDAVCGLLEVTTACNRMCTRYPLYVISFLTGFGGISVHFQIFSALKSIDINKGLFFLFRILQGIIASAVTYILLILFPVTSEVFSTVKEVQGTVASSVWGCIALILTAVCFLNSISYTKLKRR